MMAAAKLEIEVCAIVRDALAAKLCKIAGQHGKTPVDLFADLTVRAISENWFAHLPDAPPRPVQEPRMTPKLVATERQLAELRHRYQECREAMQGALILIPKISKALQAEADRRVLDRNTLAYRILEIVATDNLYAALLDH